jgi:hypothetical protein
MPELGLEADLGIRVIGECSVDLFRRCNVATLFRLGGKIQHLLGRQQLPLGRGWLLQSRGQHRLLSGRPELRGNRSQANSASGGHIGLVLLADPQAGNTGPLV